MISRTSLVSLLSFVLVAGLGQASAATGATTERVSLSSVAAQANGTSDVPSMSDDGRYVAFLSDSSTLVAGDTNDAVDVFVRDRVAGTTKRVSVSNMDGTQANDHSFAAAISADGRFVAFVSTATNLVVPDVLRVRQEVFVRDLVAGTTERVSVPNGGGAGDIANGSCWGISISAHGRFVAFASDAFNLVDGDTNGPVDPDDGASGDDVFVRDRVAGTTERVSVSSAGSQTDGISGDSDMSADGRYVAFASSAPNLIAGGTGGGWGVFVHDRVAGTTQLVNVPIGVDSGWGSDTPSISADGRFVAFVSAMPNLVARDTNNVADIFVRDRVAGSTRRVSVSSGGAQANRGSFGARISADGRYVAFSSAARNLVAGDSNGTIDVFERDRVAGTTERMSVSASGAQGNERSGTWSAFGISGASVSINADGGLVAFSSVATNLVPNDTNGVADVFVRHRAAAAPVCGGRVATIVGTAGDDVLVGTAASDVILGRGGDDTVNGGGGRDVICGRGGADLMAGGAGDDWLLGMTGRDTLRGGRGHDDCNGGAGIDIAAGCEIRTAIP